MVTVIFAKTVTSGKQLHQILGLSTDEKPYDRANGSAFLEMDTGNVYVYSEEDEEWLNLSEVI